VKNSETIAFLQPRFGPYHVARLRAVIQSSEKTHFRVLPIQISASDQYSWPEDTCSELGTLTLSPVKYEAITKNAISSLLNKTLGSVRPSAIFINGWGNYDSRVALRWAVENGTPVVISCDSRSEDYRRSWLRERLKARVVALGDAFFVSGTQSENYLISLRCPRNKM
jgi:hypothetical protein